MLSFALLFALVTAVLRGYPHQGRVKLCCGFCNSEIGEQTARVAFMMAMSALARALWAGARALTGGLAVHGGMADGAVSGFAVWFWLSRCSLSSVHPGLEEALVRQEGGAGRISLCSA